MRTVLLWLEDGREKEREKKKKKRKEKKKREDCNIRPRIGRKGKVRAVTKLSSLVVDSSHLRSLSYSGKAERIGDRIGVVAGN